VGPAVVDLVVRALVVLDLVALALVVLALGELDLLLRVADAGEPPDGLAGAAGSTVAFADPASWPGSSWPGASWPCSSWPGRAATTPDTARRIPSVTQPPAPIAVS
jgi:hypothetical protein